MNVTCLVFTQKNAPLFHNRISTLSNFSAEPNNSNYATYSSRDDPTTKTPALHSSASNVRPTHCWLRYSALQISPLFPTFSAIISLFFVRFRACRMKWADHAHIRLSGGELPALHGGHSFGSLRNRRWTSPRNAIPNAVFGWELSEPAGHVRSQFADGTHIARRIRSAKCLEFAIICSTSSAVPSVGCAKP